jgi:hypothetical protein
MRPTHAPGAGRSHPSPSRTPAQASGRAPRTWLASTSSYAFACRSHSAAPRMSASRMQPLLLLYANTLQCCG